MYTSNDYQYESKHSKRSESSLIYQQHAVLVMNWVYLATAGFLGNHLKSAENWVLREDEQGFYSFFCLILEVISGLQYFKKSSNMAKIWKKKKNLISISPCHFLEDFCIRSTTTMHNVCTYTGLGFLKWHGECFALCKNLFRVSSTQQ